MDLNKNLNIKSIISSIIIINIMFIAVYSQKLNTYKTPITTRETEIKVFFTNPESEAFVSSCSAGAFVKRKIPTTKKVADAALKAVFAGPTNEEKAKGMVDIAALGKYYIGVSIKKGVAIVNFRRGAEEHLYVNGPICMSENALAPIEQTLKQFKNIKSVEYAINGDIIEDWDA